MPGSTVASSGEIRSAAFLSTIRKAATGPLVTLVHEIDAALQASKQPDGVDTLNSKPSPAASGRKSSPNFRMWAKNGSPTVNLSSFFPKICWEKCC